MKANLPAPRPSRRRKPEKLVTVGDILDQYIDDCSLRGIRQLQQTKHRCDEVREFLGTTPLAEVNAKTIRDLQLALVRKRPDRSTGSVNTIVGSLKTALRLAADNGVIDHVPHFPRRLRNPPPRQGFLEHREFLKVLDCLPRWAKDPITFLYLTGWRKMECLTLTWNEVDLEGGVIRLLPSRSKNGRPRICPIAGELVELMERRARIRRKDCPNVFYRVKRKKGLDRPRHGTWTRERALGECFAKACQKAGLRKFIIHDLRRTAIRNMVRAGIPEAIVMKLSGHVDRAVFERYNIVAENELAGAAQKLQRYLATKASDRPGKALPFKKRGT